MANIENNLQNLVSDQMNVASRKIKNIITALKEQSLTNQQRGK